MKLEFSRQVSKKYSNTKFHENPPSASRDVPCRRTDGPIDMTKLIDAFRNVANAPRNTHLMQHGKTIADFLLI